MDDVQNIDLNLPKQRVYFIKTPLFKRFLSFLIDIMIFNTILGPLRNITEKYSELISGYSVINLNNSFYGSSSYVAVVSLTMIFGFLFFLYNFIFQYYFGQTIGMMFFNTRLVNIGAIERAKKMGKNASMNPGFRNLKNFIENNMSVNLKNSKEGLKLKKSSKESSKENLKENLEEDLKESMNNSVDKIHQKNYISAIPVVQQIFLRNIIFIPILPFVIFWLIDPIFLVIKKERFIDKFVKIGVVEQFLM